MTLELERALRAGSALSGVSSAGCSKNSEFKPLPPNTQVHFHGPVAARPRLRVVEASPLRLRRVLDVRITANDGRSAYGRSRVFHLTHDELEELIDVAVRIEGCGA